MSRPAALPAPSAVSDLQLLRLSDAAAIARLSERTLRRALHARRNRLRCYRFGHAVRIAPDDLAAWLRAHAALPVVSTAVLDTLSPTAQELIQHLNQSPARSAGRGGDRTAKAPPTAPTNNLRPEAPTRLDCGAESSVHVLTDPRSKEEPIPMHDVTTMVRFRAIPARTARGRAVRCACPRGTSPRAQSPPAREPSPARRRRSACLPLFAPCSASSSLSPYRSKAKRGSPCIGYLSTI
jgi:hypothetical protein